MSLVGFIKNFIKKTEPEPDDTNFLEMSEYLKNSDSDYRFIQLFLHSGGVLKYCENEIQATENILEISQNEEIKTFFCTDPKLQYWLNKLKIPYTDEITEKTCASLITCEYLTAYDGRIILSPNNILKYDISDLGEKIIVLAYDSQIEENLSHATKNALQKGKIIKSLNSLGGKKTSLDKGHNVKLFLLLLEN